MSKRRAEAVAMMNAESNKFRHRLLPIGTRPLHQTEAFLVARTTARGIWAGQCSCGLLVFGANEVDRFVIWREHRDAAHAVANGRDG